MPESLIVTFDRLQGDKAVLRTGDGQELVVDVNLIPADTTEGGQLDMILRKNEASTNRAVKNVRSLLRKIINGKH